MIEHILVFDPYCSGHNKNSPAWEAFYLKICPMSGAAPDLIIGVITAEIYRDIHQTIKTVLN